MNDDKPSEFQIMVTFTPPPEPEFDEENPPQWFDTTGTPYWDEDEEEE